mgnify:CR=1 FL=1
MRRHLNLRKFKKQQAFKGLAKVFWNTVDLPNGVGRRSAPHNLQFCWKPWCHTKTGKPPVDRFS